jgi:hypothetical protein
MDVASKRINSGCVSVFSNESSLRRNDSRNDGSIRAPCLNPAGDKRIVLLAARSGITPTMAILRYL